MNSGDFMGTKFVDVYDKFLRVVEDKKIVQYLPLDKSENILFGLLEQAISIEFTHCKQDLTVDVENKQFVNNLTTQEQWIIAHYMGLAWIRKQLQTDSNLREKIGHRDYQFYSPNSRLKELREIKNDVETTVKSLTRRYEYGRDFKGWW